MFITYLGDAPTTWRGRAFEPGLAVEVCPIADAAMISKAGDNPFFEVTGAEPTDVEASEPEQNDAPTIDELRAQARELGIKFGPRTGAEKLQELINAELGA